MIYKKIVLFCLFFSSQLFSMSDNPIKTGQISKQRKLDQLSKDILQRNYQWNSPLFEQILISDTLPVKKTSQRLKQRQSPKKFSYEQLSKDILQQNYRNSPLFAVSDVLPNIMYCLDIKSTLGLLATCKYLQTYKDKGFVLSPETYMQEMIRLCQAGDKEQVGELMRRGALVHEKQIKLILRCFKVNCSDFDNLDVIMRIYGKKYNSECEDFSELKTEIEFGDLAENPVLCQLLLEQGLSPNIYGIDEMYGNVPLIMAVIERGNLEVLQLLLRHAKIEPNKEIKRGLGEVKTPLVVAIDRGNSEAIELLLKTDKVDPNKEVRYPGLSGPVTPLINAINRWNSEIKPLENDKVDLNKKNERRETPLFWAAKNSSVEIVGMFLNHNKVKRKNLFWYDLPHYVLCNPDLIKLCTTYKAGFLYCYGYIAGYLRRAIDSSAAINNDAYIGDIALNMSFLSMLLSLAFYLNCLKSFTYQ